MSANKLLPEFEKPPVSEVAVSAEFAPLSEWRGPHAGLFWAVVNADYPLTEVQMPVPSQIEVAGDEAIWQPPVPRVEFLRADTNRTWFLTEAKTRLIQVQRDRFVMNWRQVVGDEPYPRYEASIRPGFVKEWKRFREFVASQKLGAVELRQCELTYINDFLRGDGWHSFTESLKLFAPWWGRGSDGFLPTPTFLNIAGSFSLPHNSGRLHFSVLPARRGIDNKEVIQLRLVARGAPDSDGDDDVMRWFDMAREWIVRGFADLTSPEAHKLWKRKV